VVMTMRFVVLVVACTSCGSSGGADPDGNTHGMQDGSNGTPTETKVGTVTIESTRYTVGTTEAEQGYASGTFYRIPPAMGTGIGGCTTQTFGACDVQTCMVAGTPTDGGLSITYTDAGPMTISGVQVNDGTMTLTPGAYGYVTVSGAVALFNGGDTVHFVAPGNSHGAPMLDVSLVAPSSVTVTAPAFVQGMVVASASHDLAVTWTGSSASAVTAQLTAGANGTSAVAHCSFPGNSGSGIVPAAAISAVRSVGGYASIMVSSESRATRNPDGWNIAFSLQSYGVVSTGLAVGTLQFD